MRFLLAEPIWAQGREREMNLSVRFTLRIPTGTRASSLRIAGSTVYRARVGSQVIAHGPSRGPHGWFRVDEWPLGGRVRTVEIEVAGYNQNSFGNLDQPSFLQAEILDEAGNVLVATGPSTPAFEMKARVQRVQRYSFQRPSSEVYRLAEPSSRVQVAVQPKDSLLEGGVPLPLLRMTTVSKVVGTGRVEVGPVPPNPWKDRSLTGISPQLKGFPEADLAEIPSLTLQGYRSLPDPAAGPAIQLGEGRYAIFDLGRNRSGFPMVEVTAERDLTLYLTFDEILSGGDVDFKRLGCVNILTLHLPKGRHRFEGFEPHTLRYLKLTAIGGGVRVHRVGFRDMECPDASSASFRHADREVNAIFQAAVETYKQNAVDIFMDCPHRERAGWLCDSFFTARVAQTLSGHSRIERNFLEAFALPPKFEFLPEGMLPMCYPADHNDGVFIPNWALWFLVELEEYRGRSGDLELVGLLWPRVAKLLDWFRGYENEHGLLEKLPSWVFVEWSAANSFVQDVNYPSNMLYAGALDAVARLYERNDLAQKASRLRQTIHEQSFDGTFYVDNAVRQGGKITPTRNRTETCQYYAFFFEVATKERDGALWSRMLSDFGPARTSPEIHKANAFIGNYLRLELLSRYGETDRLLAEIKGYFSKMAELTGTLWENDSTVASCCHGFASHVAQVLVRDILGVKHVDPLKRTVAMGSIQAEGRIPLEPGQFLEVRAGKVRVPPGWTVERESA